MNHIELSDAKLFDILNLINRSIKTYRLLITDIGIIAKVENDMAVLENVDVTEIIDNVVWSLSDRIKESGAHIIRNLDVKELLFSKKNMRSIMFNLISNAIKFRSKKVPEINIRTRLEASFVVLEVSDNGIGMQPNELDTIFEMYGRLNQDIEGTGIGLYLAKKIVNATGGKIEVTSAVGKGSKFSIYLKELSKG